MMFRAPASFAAITDAIARRPGPMITTSSPSVVSGTTAPHSNPPPNALKRHASSIGIDSGIEKSRESGCSTMYSAYAPHKPGRCDVDSNP